MLPHRYYISLPEAAQELGLTERHLIHLGAMDQLPIFTLPNPEWKDGFIIEKDVALKDEEKSFYNLRPQLFRIEFQTLIDFEAYPETAAIYAFRCRVGDDREMKDAIVCYTTRDHQPIRVKDCFLAVRTVDLEQLLTAAGKRIEDRSRLTENVGAPVDGVDRPNLSAGRERQKQRTTEQREKWIERAKQIKAEFRTWSDSQIATKIAKEEGNARSPNTIRNAIMGKI